MNKAFAKVLALVVMLALVLSGCNLIEIDAKMQADEEIAKIDAAYNVPVATYSGGEITASEAMGDFNSYYNEMAYMYYYYFGTDVTQEDVEMMASDVLTEHVRAEIAAARFDEAYELSAEEIEAMESDIQYTYDQNLQGALEAAEGKNDNAKQENARVLLREAGMDYDSLYANIETSAKMTRMEEILRAEITEVTGEELQAAYDAKVIEQEGLYTDGSSFESAMSGEDEIVCWMPEGYRTVKHILVMPGEEIKTAYAGAAADLANTRSDLETLEQELFEANDDDLAEGERTAEEIQAEIDAVQATVPVMEEALAKAEQACLDAVKAATDEIYAKLEAGEDFESLIAEYGEDPGMQNEPTMSRGYYVSEASQNWEVNFRDASMALENVGDYTLEPVVSGSGVHIIQYTADVPAGMVDIETVREALTAETLQAMQDAHCEETIAAWVEEAAPSYDVDGFLAVYTSEIE